MWSSKYLRGEAGEQGNEGGDKGGEEGGKGRVRKYASDACKSSGGE
jgi:hypothetical protein